MSKTYRLRVPGTSANLGPGFDAAGLALGLYNDLLVRPTGGAAISLAVEGEGADSLDLQDNLIIEAYRRAFEVLQKPAPGVRLESFNRIPLARGIGSSSAAIVAGIAAAQVVSAGALSLAAAIDLASAMDGHPDNVLPALVGGICVACRDQEEHVYWHRIDPPQGLYAMVLIPDYPLPTGKARQAMPEAYSREEAVYNIGHYGLAVAAFMSENLALLKEALKDRLHEPYRLPLMPGMARMRELALDAGALAAPVSGAGSTMLVLSDKPLDVAPFMAQAAEEKIKLQALKVPIIAQGVQPTDTETEMVLWP